MRRVLALLLMCLVPLQYTWAVAGLHVHPGEPADGGFVHLGSDPAAAAAGSGLEDAAGQAEGDQDPHCHFCHHLPSLVFLDAGLPAGIPLPDKPVADGTAVPASHIPPVCDRPPRELARA